MAQLLWLSVAKNPTLRRARAHTSDETAAVFNLGACYRNECANMKPQQSLLLEAVASAACETVLLWPSGKSTLTRAFVGVYAPKSTTFLRDFLLSLTQTKRRRNAPCLLQTRVPKSPERATVPRNAEARNWFLADPIFFVFRTHAAAGASVVAVEIKLSADLAVAEEVRVTFVVEQTFGQLCTLHI